MLQNLLPYFTGFMAVCFYAALAPLAKKMQSTIPPFAFISLTMIILGLYAGLLAFFIEKNFSLESLSSSNWIFLLFFSLVNLIGFFLYLTTIRLIPVAEYQMLMLFTPIVGGILAIFILGEGFKPQYLIGTLVMGIGLYISLK